MWPSRPIHLGALLFCAAQGALDGREIPWSPSADHGPASMVAPVRPAALHGPPPLPPTPPSPVFRALCSVLRAPCVFVPQAACCDAPSLRTHRSGCRATPGRPLPGRRRATRSRKAKIWCVQALRKSMEAVGFLPGCGTHPSEFGVETICPPRSVTRKSTHVHKLVATGRHPTTLSFEISLCVHFLTLCRPPPSLLSSSQPLDKPVPTWKCTVHPPPWVTIEGTGQVPIRSCSPIRVLSLRAGVLCPELQPLTFYSSPPPQVLNPFP